MGFGVAYGGVELVVVIVVFAVVVVAVAVAREGVLDYV